MKSGIVSPDFLFTFGFTIRKHTCNISISEIAISNLFRKSKVDYSSNHQRALLELVTILYCSIALRLLRPRYAIVIVKLDICRNRVNIGYS